MIYTIIGRKDGRREGEIYPAARELIFTRIIMNEGEGWKHSPLGERYSRRRGI